MKLIKLLAAALAVTLLPVAAAQAQISERAVKFATQNPKGHPITNGMEKFAEIVAAKVRREDQGELFPGGVLGGDAPNISALQGGTLEMVVMNAGILAQQVKDFEVFDFPFMFATTAEADAVVDGPFGRMLLDKLDAKNIHGLAYWELGFRSITNSKRAITKVEDIAGLKLRVIPNAINVDWVSALGANPTPMAFPEVYAGLEQKAIDGQENPLTVINANKFYEVQKFVTLTNHQYNPQAVIVSKKLWDALSNDEKKIFSDAAHGSRHFRAQEFARANGERARVAQEERDDRVRILAGRTSQAARQDEAGHRQARWRDRRDGQAAAGRDRQGPQVSN
jgi:tripartite ATP-independent transporter DctP family solute receptor